MKHPARTLDYATLWDGLQQAKADQLVSEHIGKDGLRLYCYTPNCVYERRWDDITLLARGVIIDPVAKRVVATPFPKFFNVGESTNTIPNLPFETFEKLDGSLIILFHHRGVWRCATKGSLSSEQAQWATQWIQGYDLSCLDTETTYLAEAIYPENRIVIQYKHTGLTLLGAYQADGVELHYAELLALADRLGWTITKRHSFGALSELIVHAKALPATEEGFVLRFSNGHRLKVKGDEYCRIHRMVSRITPLAMWEAMQAGENLEAVRRELPEEFWTDFDTITSILQQQIAELIDRIRIEAEAVAHLSDKEVGLRLETFPAQVRRFLFAYRANKGDLLSNRSRDLIFRTLRPTGNLLKGYAPSIAMNRITVEDA